MSLPADPQVSFAVVARATGEIVRTGSCPRSDLRHQPRPGPDEIQIETAAAPHPGRHYYDLSGPAPVMVARPRMALALDTAAIAANGEDLATVSGVPAGALVRLTGPDTDASDTVDDGTYQLGSEVAGTFTVTVTAWPHRDQELVVVAS